MRLRVATGRRGTRWVAASDVVEMLHLHAGAEQDREVEAALTHIADRLYDWTDLDHEPETGGQVEDHNPT